LPQDQRLGLLLVERQALRDGLGGVERVGGVGDGADGPPKGADGGVFVRREPRAELPREALDPCGQGDGRRASEVSGLKMVFLRGGRVRIISVFFDGRQESKDEKRERQREERKSERKSRFVFLLFFPQGFCASCRGKRAPSSLSSIAKRSDLPLEKFPLSVPCPLTSPQVRQLDNIHRPIQRE